MIGTLVREDLQGLEPVFRKNEQCDECDGGRAHLYYQLVSAYKGVTNKSLDGSFFRFLLQK
jgi:hypothetical protein